MRCKNCGWENPPEKQKCEKCNAPLNGSMAENTPSEQNSPVLETLETTVYESNKAVLDNMGHANIVACPICKYPTNSNMNVCPSCGHVLKTTPDPISPDSMKKCRKCNNPLPNEAKFCPNCGTTTQMTTVDSWYTPQQGSFCTLKPIAWRGEEAQYNPITYSGEIITLNRSNTDPNNNTITSKEQAILIRENNAWYIEDRSEQHSTLIRIKRKMRLESGDVIVLGNRMFEFKG